MHNTQEVYKSHENRQIVFQFTKKMETDTKHRKMNSVPKFHQQQQQQHHQQKQINSKTFILNMAFCLKLSSRCSAHNLFSFFLWIELQNWNVVVMRNQKPDISLFYSLTFSFHILILYSQLYVQNHEFLMQHTTISTIFIHQSDLFAVLFKSVLVRNVVGNSFNVILLLFF